MEIWLLPYVTYATIAGITVILISMIFIDSMRSQLFLTMLISAGLIISFFLKKKQTEEPENSHRTTEGKAINS